MLAAQCRGDRNGCDQAASGIGNCTFHFSWFASNVSEMELMQYRWSVGVG